MGDVDGAGPTAAARSSPELVPPELWPDPHPHYHRMRAETPIKAFPEWDEYVLTRWADCERVLRDPDHAAPTPTAAGCRPDFLDIGEHGAARARCS